MGRRIDLLASETARCRASAAAFASIRRSTALVFCWLLVLLVPSSRRWSTKVVADAMAASSLPSPSSRTSPMSTLPTTNCCAVVGVGVLGTSLCRQILQCPAFADAVVTGITKTADRHDSIRRAVLIGDGDGHNNNDVAIDSSNNNRLRLATAAAAFEKFRDSKFRNVVFCAPPSGFENYAGAVKDAVENLWAGPEGGGTFVFTSSGGIYGSGNGDIVTESSPIAEDAMTNPRQERLIRAEDYVLEAGGCCLRLAGLYNLQRGAHNFWLTRANDGVSGSPNGRINQLHYDDAAGACLAALKAEPAECRGRVFLISDGNPMTRREICESTVKAKVYRGYSMPTFLGSDGGKPEGKIYDGSVSNAQLKWSPSYPSFGEFMAANE